MPYHFSEPVKDLITRILNPDPVARITIQQIENHPWMKHNVPKHLTIRSFKKHRISQPKIDEDVLQMTLQTKRMIGMDKKIIREKILKRKSDDLTVCYELLLDQKLTESKAKYNIENSKPLFKQEVQDHTDFSTMASSRNDNTDVILSYDTPNNWVFGFRSNMETSQFVYELHSALKDSDLE